MDEEDGLAAFSASNPSWLPENKQRYILDILIAFKMISHLWFSRDHVKSVIIAILADVRGEVGRRRRRSWFS